MFLPVFNLTAEEIALLKNKFYFLRVSTLEIINELVERINKSENLFQLNEDEKKQLELRNQILRERKEQLTSGMEQTTVSAVLPIEVKITWLEWLKKQRDYLRNEKTLPRVASISPSSINDALKALWESWEKHSVLAYHTNQSLVEVTTVLLHDS